MSLGGISISIGVRVYVTPEGQAASPTLICVNENPTGGVKVVELSVDLKS